MFGDNLVQTNLWEAGQHGYNTYRIPALAVTHDGTLLAFCEARRHDRHDTGDIDMMVKRSTDCGTTWSEQITVWNQPDNVCGNPSPVVDRNTGTTWLLMTWNRGDDPENQIVAQTSTDTRRVFVTSSTDDGLTWAEPREITEAVKKPNWTWYATGPGGGIQIENGAYAGRMVVPCDHIEAETKDYYSHVIYSDDGGATWVLGGRSPQPQVNECEVVELSGGRLLLNMRNYDRNNKVRQIMFSDDGGATWRDQQFDGTLIEPICQASIQRAGTIILFANPASTDSRANMTVRASHDEAKTWQEQLILYDGPSAYSDLAVCADGRVACLYECGDEHPYKRLRLALFDLE